MSSQIPLHNQESDNNSQGTSSELINESKNKKQLPSLSLLSSPSLKKSQYSKSHNTTEDNNEQIQAFQIASPVAQPRNNSLHKIVNNDLEQPELYFKSKGSQLNLHSSQNSQMSIQSLKNTSHHQDQLDQTIHKDQIIDHSEHASQANTPSNIKMNPNLAHMNKQQFLKKQSIWHGDVDPQKYKPHQIHQKIDLLSTFDQNLDNKDAVELLKCILSKHPGKRNSKEVQFVRKCLQQVKFFQEIEKQLPEDLILRLCKFITYEKYPQFHRLYRAGDFGRKFYIILDGAVFILTPSITKTFDSNSQDNKEEKQIKQMIMNDFVEDTPRNFFAQKKSDDIKEDEDFIEQVVQTQNEGFNIKKTLDKGESFGEIALRTEGIRTASVVCKEDTHFVSITATTYNEVIDAYHDMLYKEKIDFLRNVSIFQRWSLAFVHEIMMQVNIKRYKRGDILYEEGERSKNLYFVRSGEVELQQTVEIKESSESFKDIPNKLVKSNHIWNEKIKNSKLKKCSLVILGPYQYFGDYEIFKKSKRITRAVCYSNSEIFVLDKKEFFENMQFINMVKEIHNLFKEREVWYRGMVKKNIDTEAHITKIISSQKALQQSQTEINPVEEEKTRRLSIIQEMSQKSIVMANNNNNTEEKSKYTKVQIDSLRYITEENEKYQQNSFLDKINIYKDYKSPKNNLEQELFYDQMRIRDKEQQKIKKQEQAIENVIKLKKFVGRSMNLIKQIESAKSISIPTVPEPRVRKSEHINYHSSELQQFDSLQQIDEMINAKLVNNNNILAPPKLFNTNSVSNPTVESQTTLKHTQSKSLQNLVNLKETGSYNYYFQQKNPQQRSSLNDTPQNIHNNVISPRSGLPAKIIIPFKKPQLSESTAQSMNNPPSSPYQLKTPISQTISSLMDKKKNLQFHLKSSLDDIENLAQEISRNVKTNKYSSLNSDDNLNFIKSQIDLNKKSLIKQKMEQAFTHRYLCEKTGRYKLPSTINMNVAAADQDSINGLNNQQYFQITERVPQSVRHIKSKQPQTESITKSNTSFNQKSHLHLEENSFKENLNNSLSSSPVKNTSRNSNNVIPQNNRISLPQILVSPKLMNKEINFSKSYKKAKKFRELFDDSQQKRVLKLC